MTAQLTRTTINGRDVILTEGMIDGATGHRIYGMFATDDDARSIDADVLAIGTIGADRLTAEQIEIAQANSESL